MKDTQIIAACCALVVVAVYAWLAIRRHTWLKGLKKGDRVLIDTATGPRIATILSIYYYQDEVNISVSMPYGWATMTVCKRDIHEPIKPL